MKKKNLFIALLLLIVGALGLTYAGLERHDEAASQARSNPGVVLGSDDTSSHLPMWAGISALLLSGFVITWRTKKRQKR
ncbi:MAG TPA: LPXTG cell wall anchor domain-containing protein [Steroidobacteraceae bacterium]|nr:LPXTG cell wall anchor domain-containing protein [Steroidobacteraceae bacterium]